MGRGYLSGSCRQCIYFGTHSRARRRQCKFGAFAVGVLLVSVKHRADGSSADVPSGGLPRRNGAPPSLDVADFVRDSTRDTGRYRAAPDTGEDADGFGQRVRRGWFEGSC